MKRFFTLLIGLIAIVGTAGADGEIYLRNNISGWGTDDNNYKSEKKWDGNQDVYEFTITETALGDNDFYFRINRYDSDSKLIGPYNHSDYTYIFSNGYTETYTAPRIDKFQGDNGAFCIKHSEIKAHEYKITIYLKYNTSITVDDTYYSDIWIYYIKIDIVSMPLEIKADAGKATFSCDRALNFSGTGVSAYAITAASGGALTKSSALTNVPANAGLYVEGTKGTYNIPVIETSSASTIETNMMVPGTGATVSQTSDGNTNFILTNKTVDGTAELKFYKVNSAGNTVNKGKAYLQIPTASVGARESYWFGDDETTNINATDSQLSTLDQSNSIYNLAGQRVTKGYKGVAIQNGKKYILK